jgi:hypothetical protein
VSQPSLANFTISYTTRLDGVAQTRRSADGTLFTGATLTFLGIAVCYRSLSARLRRSFSFTLPEGRAA